MSASAGKRRRQLEVEPVPTESDSGMSNVDEASPPKRARGSAASASQEAQSSGSGSQNQAVDPPIADQAVAMTAAVAQAAQAAVASGQATPQVTAAEKRARFLAKYAGKTPEEILDSISRKWRSKVYDHYKPPRVIVATAPNAPNLHRFVCKTHPSVWIDRADYEDSTGNLMRHYTRCEPRPTPETEAIMAFANGTTYSPARMRYYIALWCARHHRPFLIVEDGELRGMLRMLYGRVEIPSRVTVSCDIRTIMHYCKNLVVAQFEAYPGLLHICVDGWTSPNILAFLSITAHWHKDGKVEHIILDFVR